MDALGLVSSVSGVGAPALPSGGLLVPGAAGLAAWPGTRPCGRCPRTVSGGVHGRTGSAAAARLWLQSPAAGTDAGAGPDVAPGAGLPVGVRGGSWVASLGQVLWPSLGCPSPGTGSTVRPSLCLSLPGWEGTCSWPLQPRRRPGTSCLLWHRDTASHLDPPGPGGPQRLPVSVFKQNPPRWPLQYSSAQTKLFGFRAESPLGWTPLPVVQADPLA